MRWPLLVSMPLSTACLTACLQLSTGGTDAGTSVAYSSSSGAASTASSSGAGGTATSGTGCVTDPQSGITLCELISNCPGVDVDQGAFPGCGFRLRGPSLYDLECGCGDSLCPIGTPTSCATAQQLLSQEGSSLGVCEQVSDGTCLPLAVDGGASSTTSTTCDTGCESECGGDPDCMQLCGC
jgi:hypothetical protein